MRKLTLLLCLLAVSMPAQARPYWAGPDVMRPPCHKPYIQKGGICVRRIDDSGMYPPHRRINDDDQTSIDEMSYDELIELSAPRLLVRDRR